MPWRPGGAGFTAGYTAANGSLFALASVGRRATAAETAQTARGETVEENWSTGVGYVGYSRDGAWVYLHADASKMCRQDSARVESRGLVLRGRCSQVQFPLATYHDQRAWRRVGQRHNIAGEMGHATSLE
jgi:hypothetical protein